MDDCSFSVAISQRSSLQVAWFFGCVPWIEVDTIAWLEPGDCTNARDFGLEKGVLRTCSWTLVDKAHIRSVSDSNASMYSTSALHSILYQSILYQSMAQIHARYIMIQIHSFVIVIKI